MTGNPAIYGITLFLHQLPAIGDLQVSTLILFPRCCGLHDVLKCVVSSSSVSSLHACIGDSESSRCASRPKLSTDFEQDPGDIKNHQPSRCIRVSLWLDVINSQKNRNTSNRASGFDVGTSSSPTQEWLEEILLVSTGSSGRSCRELRRPVLKSNDAIVL